MAYPYLMSRHPEVRAALAASLEGRRPFILRGLRSAKPPQDDGEGFAKNA